MRQMLHACNGHHKIGRNWRSYRSCAPCKANSEQSVMARIPTPLLVEVVDFREAWRSFSFNNYRLSHWRLVVLKLLSIFDFGRIYGARRRSIDRLHAIARMHAVGRPARARVSHSNCGRVRAKAIHARRQRAVRLLLRKAWRQGWLLARRRRCARSCVDNGGLSLSSERASDQPTVGGCRPRKLQTPGTRKSVGSDDGAAPQRHSCYPFVVLPRGLSPSGCLLLQATLVASTFTRVAAVSPDAAMMRDFARGENFRRD